MAKGRVWDVGTVAKAKARHIHWSPFGVIPKKNKPSKWRLILNLSAPEETSINDGIPKKLCSLAYMSVDDLVHQAMAAGKGADMAKIDVSQAYRNVQVHADDRGILCMEWHCRVFVDGTLPFGLWSAPLLFTALGDAIQWVSLELGSTWVGHYINDFVTIGPRCVGAIYATSKGRVDG